MSTAEQDREDFVDLVDDYARDYEHYCTSFHGAQPSTDAVMAVYDALVQRAEDAEKKLAESQLLLANAEALLDDSFREW